jgi:hypothetical protein
MAITDDFGPCEYCLHPTLALVKLTGPTPTASRRPETRMASASPDGAPAPAPGCFICVGEPRMTSEGGPQGASDSECYFTQIAGFRFPNPPKDDKGTTVDKKGRSVWIDPLTRIVIECRKTFALKTGAY